MTRGPVVTEREIRELVERMERCARVSEEHASVRKAEGLREAAQMLRDLLEEHGL
jgi:hypothetical protein